MAGEVTRRWNTLYPSLYKIYKRLEELGFVCNNYTIISPEVFNKKIIKGGES